MIIGQSCQFRRTPWLIRSTAPFFFCLYLRYGPTTYLPTAKLCLLFHVHLFSQEEGGKVYAASSRVHCISRRWGERRRRRGTVILAQYVEIRAMHWTKGTGPAYCICEPPSSLSALLCFSVPVRLFLCLTVLLSLSRWGPRPLSPSHPRPRLRPQISTLDGDGAKVEV